MFRLLAIQIIKWRNQWKKFWKQINSTETRYYHNYATGTSGTFRGNTNMTPEQEKQLWETFDNSFKMMDNSFKMMDESFKHMDDVFKNKNEK